MSAMVNNAKELNNIFFNYSKVNDHKAMLFKGVYVSTKVRREVMLNIEQGRITINGWVTYILFENLGGGVYRAFVEIKGD